MTGESAPGAGSSSDEVIQAPDHGSVDHTLVIADMDKPVVRDFLEKVKVEYPMAIDPEARMKGTLGVEGIPHVLVIDSAGIVRWQGWPEGKTDRLTKKVLRQIIEEDKRARLGEEF